MFSGVSDAAEGSTATLVSYGAGGTVLSASAAATPDLARARREPIMAQFDDRQPAASRHRARAAAGWARRYDRGVILVDLLAATTACGVALLTRFGTATGAGDLVDRVFALLLPLAWLAAAWLSNAYERRFLGVGTTEYERLGHAFLCLSVVTAFVSFAANLELSRGFLVIALPLALVLSCAGRAATRTLLYRSRARGRSMTSVLAVGCADTVAAFATALRRDRSAGLEVVGACLPAKRVAGAAALRQLTELGIPVLGDLDCVRESVATYGAGGVVMLAGEVDAATIRRVSWQLEGSAAKLIVAPGLTELSGRRVHVQPVAGLPLLYVDEPQFTGARRALKSVFDRAAAATALLVLWPVLLGIALLVRCTSSGPALFRQERVGRDGRTFKMIKFRTMHAGAELRVVELRPQNETADGPLFKIRHDPRVTRVGRSLRRYSLDELPQLINVLLGSMSLVGPRPPLPAEVACYPVDVRRRLLVKPGLTGLWQISGRSDLSWDEAVGLDLRYVENWSLLLDVGVLMRTFGAVVRARGAY
jgi:exopolysaccharide biosynthesis polyprenyl glycosylphosphotransferase